MAELIRGTFAPQPAEFCRLPWMWKIERGDVEVRLDCWNYIPEAYGRPVRFLPRPRWRRAKLAAMNRTAVNPWQWSIAMGFNQAELVEGADKVLYCAGQTSVDGDGNVQHAGDMAAQISLALDNVETVLAEAGMSLANLVRLNIYTTDVDAFFEHYGVAGQRLAAAGVAPPGTLLGITRLAFPDLLVELEATAAG